ncbi:C4-dicarboxylate ABC transporter substrate-binding protein [Vibrio nigripulchritudo]|uniref:TRAP transporter substrate-binding protein DctP n=1 Tax=Vibrio nigripulchritudo TaxID=28173 RepID=UPI00190976EE|nr:TRAP transporter substrate-binding protein DctP [Vibrio nigripulchritudo]BCL73301.1 C4-dicarboxylate ABC transporter substrate-binding protein [Vibrio nigripulchritudo]BDU34666.1 C4-dicarboxylate ABC transporter substrate-binding protein [Vibrio nigripulchritudo]
MKAIKIALLCLPFLWAEVVAAKEYQFNLVTMTPKKSDFSVGFKKFVDDMNEEFKGELKINWRGGPEITPPFKLADSVRNGALDMVISSPSYYSGLLPAASSSNLSHKTYKELTENGYYQRMEELHAEKGLVLLGEIPASAMRFHIFLRDKVTNIDDLKGKRLRVFPSVLPMVEALGGSPLVLPIGEIYTSMERGTVDGFIRGKNGWASQFEGVVKYAVSPGVYRVGFNVLVNQRAWNRLPDDLRQRAKDYLNNTISPEIDASWDDYLKQGDQELKDAGIQVVEFSQSEQEKYKLLAMDAAWKKMAQDAPDVAEELKRLLVE